MRKFRLIGVLLITFAWSAATTSAGQSFAGLGDYKASRTTDNRLVYTLAAADFTFTRVTVPQTGESVITIAGTGAESALVIHIGGSNRLTIERGGRIVVVNPGEDNAEAIRMMTGGRAITAFRYRVGSYERRLADDQATLSDALSPFAYSVLLSAAFVGELAGDPNALGRTRDLIRRRIAAKIRAAAWQQRDCVTDYELALIANDERQTQCLDAADGLDSFFARAAERLLCGAEFLAGAISAETQFAQCSAFKLQ